MRPKKRKLQQKQAGYRNQKAKFSAKTTSGSVGTAVEEKKKAKKRKLEEKQSISNIDIYI